MTSGGDHSGEQQEQAEAEIHLRTPATTDSDQAAQAAPSTNYETPFSHLEVGHAHGQIAYLNIDPYYGGIYAPYGGQPMMHPQLVGVQQTGMSLPIDAVEEPIYVNAKQYNAILRRRQSRAKAESENRHFKRRKPYLHESRHQHALRRVRGSGGRFLNRKPNDYMEESSSSTSSDEENGVEPGNDREPSTSSPSNGASFAK